MPSLNRNEEVKCGDCGIINVRQDVARHRKRCEKLKEHKCPNCHFYTKSKEEMGDHVAKKHAEPSSKQSTVCPLSFLRTGVPKLVLSPTTSEKGTWN